MQAASLSAYEQLLERARGLGLRTLDLSNAVFGALRA
jgi:regulator of sigma D